MGDYGMLINNVFDLNAKDITLFSYDNDFLKKINKRYLFNHNVKIVEVKVNSKIDHVLKDGYVHTPLELLDYIENYNELSSVMESNDLLMVNGGGYFNELWSKPHRISRLLKIIAPILIANQLNKKIAFSGNSFGPFGSNADFFLGIFGRLTNAIFHCRDNLYSPLWLRQLGIDSAKINYLPDDLLIVNQQIYELKTEVDIKVNRYIVMENYLPVEFLETNMDHFIDFSKTMYERYGLSIVFLPFHLANGGMNQAELLGQNLDHYQFVDLSRYGFLPLQDAIHVISGAELVISSRYHALVLAVGTRTPIINVLKDVVNDKRYYYNKSVGVLQEVLQGIPFDERLYIGTDYIETLNHVKNHFDEIRDMQLANYNEQFEKNMANLRAIRSNFIESVQE